MIRPFLLCTDAEADNLPPGLQQRSRGAQIAARLQAHGLGFDEGQHLGVC
jgi:hypothetical protein